MKTQVLMCKFFLSACLLLPVAQGQERLDSPDKVANAIGEVKSGNFALITVERIAEAHAVDAIPVLKEQFVLSKDDLEKGKIAAALVRLGDKDNTYWDYLVAGANAALDSDLPFVSTSTKTTTTSSARPGSLFITQIAGAEQELQRRIGKPGIPSRTISPRRGAIGNNELETNGRTTKMVSLGQRNTIRRLRKAGIR